jgi:2-oxoglutarate/2-oxoacid ferredoxin oxidoreductase subunit alpha
MILSDGAIGQMMEKVYLPEQKVRLTDEEVEKKYGSWASVGKKANREHNIVTSLSLQPEAQEKHNIKIQTKYRQIEETEVRYEKIACDDAEYIFVAYGTSARICQKGVQLAREKGYKVGLFRPITLWPFPSKELGKIAANLKGILAVEMSAGQMVEDVKLAVECKIKVEHFGRFGGMIHSPSEVLQAIEQKLIKQ